MKLTQSPLYQTSNLYSAPWLKATIHNLDTVSEVQVLFTVLDFLKNQGRRSGEITQEYGFTCAYRSFYHNTILKCAAGVFLPNNFEFKDPNDNYDLRWSHFIDKYRISKKWSGLIDKLQTTHDATNSWTEKGFVLRRDRVKILRSILTTSEAHRVLDYFEEQCGDL